MSTPTFSFAAGVVTRALLALCYAAAVWTAVRSIEGQHDELAAPPEGTGGRPAQAPDVARVELTSSYPVAAWTVRINGVLVSPKKTETHAWSAEIATTDPIDVFVEATRSDPLASEPCAVQVRVIVDGVTHTESLWGTGAVSGNARVGTWP